VPYRGGAPATLDVSAGRVDIMVANVAEVAPMIQAGQLKGLAVTSAAPSPMLPGLLPLARRYPTLAIDNWFGLCGPAGLPDDIRAGLAALFAAALAEPQTAGRLRERGLEPLVEDGAALGRRIQAERAHWRAVAAAGGIRADG
jgi:tripartite-type tricarboxylate transporter receptor subunit TctC